MPIGPCLTYQILKMMTTAESKINLIFDKLSDWIQWYFVVQDTVKNNKVWKYIDLSKKKDKFLKLKLPNQPTSASVLSMTTSISNLNQHQLTAYN